MNSRKERKKKGVEGGRKEGKKLAMISFRIRWETEILILDSTGLNFFNSGTDDCSTIIHSSLSFGGECIPTYLNLWVVSDYMNIPSLDL